MNPNDCENWIVWGVILKTVGNYKSAKNKYEQALKIDPTNETAQEELEMIDEIIELDGQLTLDQAAGLKRMRPAAFEEQADKDQMFSKKGDNHV